MFWVFFIRFGEISVFKVVEYTTDSKTVILEIGNPRVLWESFRDTLGRSKGSAWFNRHIYMFDLMDTHSPTKYLVDAKLFNRKASLVLRMNYLQKVVVLSCTSCTVGTDHWSISHD